MHLTTRGVVLRQVDYKESDRILTVLTEQAGKITVTARGSRKKNSAIAAGTQLLCWSELVLYEFRDRWAVREASVLRPFTAVVRDLERFSLACYFAQVAELLAVEGAPAPDILALLLNSMHILDTRPDYPPAQVKAVYELRLMCMAGFAPVLGACAVCGREEVTHGSFHLREGALHCAECGPAAGGESSVPIGGGTLAALRHIALGEEKRIFSFRLEGEALRNLAEVCEAYLLSQLERGFQTLDFYRQLVTPAADACAEAAQ